ncbi:DUF3850 domain-containing protein [Levilactobacillus acidifarinae]|uniref:DUF3850 domain-containing protein n=1 Tax=Levilactobacillus acidifarinae TaxID=267364 RepID=UPI000708D977|nr:DUF3850 domain-containing protein [Levilactobacillus acidifarinae]GEO70520.1 hypothetical protein LAC03_24300 [Levilactobacillus acidifarinae]
MARIHNLKVLPEYFEEQMAGRKRFEIRKNDRDYQVGDQLNLREWDGKKYTGFCWIVWITYMTDYQQKPGYVVLGTTSENHDLLGDYGHNHD